MTIQNLFIDGFYPLRECSMCESTIGYIVEAGLPYFDPHCGCMNYRIEPPRPVSNEEFRVHLNKLEGK